MITAEMRAEIRRLVLAEGWRIETVARRFGVHHSVVRRVIRDDAHTQAEPPVPIRSSHTSSSAWSNCQRLPACASSQSSKHAA